MSCSAIKEAKVKIDNCTVYITPKGCLRWNFAVNRWSHCFHICRSRSKQHHDSAKGKGTQLGFRVQGIPWVVDEMETSSCYFHEKTTLAQRLPADMEDKVVEFHRFVLRARQRWGYESSQILNMDETPMRFELPATRTLEFTGNRTVPILSCGGDEQSFTVVLAMTILSNDL